MSWMGRVGVAWVLLATAARFSCCSSSKLGEFIRDDFPADFVFGASTSSYQVEGAAAEDGRSPSIWDTFTHAGKMPDKSNGDVTADGYHKYKEDVELIAATGLEAYRFSISWSRLIPGGRGAVNPKGLEYYNNLIDGLLKHGIHIHVTIYHLDLPQVLEDKYGGWLSPKIVDDFTAYADVCFREFGDRVTHWTTLAEPNVIGQGCYDSGIWPPGRCSYPYGLVECSAGNSTVEPYLSVHNLLLAHSSAAKLYRTKYQALQNGRIGINVYTTWSYPFHNTTADQEAVKRVQDFSIGWILGPLVYGEYPQVMRKNAGFRLPVFTESQSEQLRGSLDFIGINHYSSAYVMDNSENPQPEPRDINADTFSLLAASTNDTPSGKFDPTKIRPDPKGMQYMLEYLKDTYQNPAIYVHENGYGMVRNNTINDTRRVEFIGGFIGRTLDAIQKGVDVRGYFVWSFMDMFEYLSGYQSSFGLYHVDFESPERTRQPKYSAHWYSQFLKNKRPIQKTGSSKSTFHASE